MNICSVVQKNTLEEPNHSNNEMIYLLNNWKLLANSLIILAIKANEVKLVRMEQVVSLGNYSCSIEEIKQYEIIIAKILDYNFTYKTIDDVVFEELGRIIGVLSSDTEQDYNSSSMLSLKKNLESVAIQHSNLIYKKVDKLYNRLGDIIETIGKWMETKYHTKGKEQRGEVILALFTFFILQATLSEVVEETEEMSAFISLISTNDLNFFNDPKDLYLLCSELSLYIE
mmetsp:Transcript_15776/g.16374  ORF Transcript_15776/g.16374 Transcript_15776/m.16374 type:complete len:228 (-) Transcript_15776:37-720(-)